MILTIVHFIFRDATTVLTIDHSCITAGGVELGARAFSMMVACGTLKHVGKNIVNICIVHIVGVITEVLGSCDRAS